MKRTFICVIASRGQIYDQLIREYWIPFIQYNESRGAGIKVLLMFGSDSNVSDLIQIEGIANSIICCPYPETMANIFHKTIYTLGFLERNCDYDLILRTNLSSFFIYDRLLEVIEQISDTNVYQGVHVQYREVTFITGCGFFLSRDVAQYLLRQHSTLSHHIIDDVDIGRILKEIPKTPLLRYDLISYHAPLTEVELESHHTAIVEEKYYHVRIKNLNREIDIQLVKFLMRSFYPEALTHSTTSITSTEPTPSSHNTPSTPSIPATSTPAAMTVMEITYNKLCRTVSDIYEHLPTLYRYGLECNHITECGVRSIISSYAFGYSLQGRSMDQSPCLVQIDPEKAPDHPEFKKLCEELGIISIFHCQSDLECPLEQTDLLFIDTWHIYGQLKRELARWHSYVNKYIIMHDTTVDAINGETIRNGWNPQEQSLQYNIPVDEITKGLWPAIEEFLAEHPEWTLQHRYTNNNGLTILQRT